MAKLINNYRFELEEDHHHPGNGIYGVVVLPAEDISPVLPYLNSILNDTTYDHENKILIGSSDKKKYAFRPHEIRAGSIDDVSDAPKVAGNIVDFVNNIWDRCESIKPSIKERKVPAAFDIFKELPRNNCRQCGCSSCLAFAVKLHAGEISIDQCKLLTAPEYAQNRENITALFS